MFSPQKAAQKANVSRKTIMNAIKSMELKAHRNNENYWVIKPTDLANWVKDRQIKGGNTPTYHPTGSITPEPDVVPPVVSPSIPTPVALENEATTKEAEFKLQLAQMELRHTQEKLDNSDKEVARLRTEVSELKEEVREARKETSEAWSMFTTFMKLMGDKPSAPDPSPNLSIDEPPVVAEAKPEPFLLLPEFRVDVAEPEPVENTPPENIFDVDALRAILNKIKA